MASPSCSSAPGSFKHDVFLSFRGEDTRKTFTSHLYAALVSNHINTYIDDEIERGEEIAPALLQAIEASKLSVVILSQGYASSRWCLNELAHILELKERHQLSVLPIFYGVDPSHVRNQRESYAAAFVQHEKHFKQDKVLKWREALTKASDLAGFDSRKTSPDSKLVEEVLKVIQKKLNRKYSRDLTPQDVEFSSRQLINGNEPDRAKDNCFKCGGIGHWRRDCPSDNCSKCGGIGHWDRDCPSDNCFKCGGIGHWDRDCPSVGDEDSHSADKCFEYGGIGHWADDSPSSSDEDSPSAYKCFEYGGIGQWGDDSPSASDEDSPSTSDEDSPLADKCSECGGIGHWAKDCPSDECFKCGGIGHYAKDCPSYKCFKCGGIGHCSKDCPSNKCIIR
ncbi:probable disease resistance protein At4g19530 [Rosa chinensis]|uniref:probable disease resistance protein At4g19530 n=1 Tax=Rosa chinensis TaxID=74649 RepID=UPI000D08720D|nr:probable disease resistance protein At4g19530 [Rosa chinensis]XP_040368043.1 probable disease resistance protein At4g19530 [Rosa chinensis]